MKHGKNPTVRQKRLIAASGKNPADWLVCKDTATEMHLVNRYTATKKLIPKGLYKHEKDI